MSILHHPLHDQPEPPPTTPMNERLPDMDRGDRLRVLTNKLETEMNTNLPLAKITLDKLRQELREQGRMA